MNWDQIAVDWKQLTGRAKAKWGKFTNNDLKIVAGKRDQLAGLLQQKTATPCSSRKKNSTSSLQR